MKPAFAILGSFSGSGGVERMMINLIQELARRRWRFDLLVLNAQSAHLSDLPENVQVVRLRSRHAFAGIPSLAAYLREQRPTALLVAKDRAGRAALVARRLARADTRILVRLGTNLTTALENRHPALQWLRTAPMRRLYADVDRIIAVSDGVAEDTRAITRLPASRVTVIRNPVITSALVERAAAPAPHAWLAEKSLPVILAAGRLTYQKGFDVLLPAFQALQATTPSRLIILGEGRERATLERLASDLEIGDRVLLPGFQANPYAWLARADLFVLPSRWEGSPNVLAEALALGIPSVATDCPSGPREILDEGRIGPLVAVNDTLGLTEAMAGTLVVPGNPAERQAAVEEYRVELSTDRYLNALGLPPYPEDTDAAV
ncbi:MAG: glycosyltransferase [Pseudomonadota bacterium]